MPKSSDDLDQYSDELKDALKDIVKSCEKEDDEIYKAMQRQWKKYEEFWHGVQYLFWSDTDEAWRSPLDFGWNDDDTEATDELGSFSDKVIDIFRGHGEAIIAALASQIPALRYLPDDADDDDDVLAARTRNKIADLIQRHNKVKLLFFRALFFLAIQGLVASYRYKDSDFKYGTTQQPDIGEQEQEIPLFVCKECDHEFNPQDVEGSPDTCPMCGSQDLKGKKGKRTVPINLGMKTVPKSRVKIDLFGPLNFKVPYYARNQSECTYFILYGDLGKDVVKSEFPDLEEKIDGEHLETHTRFARSDFMTVVDPEIGAQNLVTVRRVWLRPAAFYRATKGQKKIREELLKKFPKGCRVTFIGKSHIFADLQPEEMDARWEIGQAGLSTYIHSDPILRPLVQIQEMRNDLVNLIIETIKHGIPFQLADPSVLDFDMYGKFEAVPGYVYKTKAARPGEAIGNAFYDSPRATLSREVAVFLQQLDKDAQFSIGSFPSVYGGPSEGKSRTFAEYAASRQMALQRLSIIWSFLVDWWTRTVSGAVDLYVESITEDERYTYEENNSYINVWIRRSELSGKIGGVEPEASETFPVSLAQKKDLIMKLMELNNDFVNQALYLPDNARVIQDVLALNEFKLPGEAQRIKQCIEINDLKNEMLAAQVVVDPDIDDHAVHIATIKAWAVDQIGLDAKQTNPQWYAGVIMHLRQHEMMLQAKTMGSGPTPPGVPPPTTQAGAE